MTTYERAAHIIAETLPKCRGEKLMDAADRILNALGKKRIAPTKMVASVDMLRRFHAHCRYLGNESGYGYKYWYSIAVDHAESVEEWPCKVLQRLVDVGGETITIDVSVPESTTRATNKQLLCAYQMIEEGAKEHGIVLPEHWEENE